VRPPKTLIYNVKLKADPLVIKLLGDTFFRH
jgi:hypothetical protein